ncbi:MAG TPA: tetratricopeptide repeat protein, partial [Candidatus Accumulibacter phosphatis]|nr:tetratricopeptide repeat protein [Candidatus Accumulibacter phosphatis]
MPEDAAPRDAGYRRDEAQRAGQQAHLARLAEVERYPEIRFANADRLAVEILRSPLHEILARAGVRTRPANLPFGSLGALFKGRDAAIAELADRLGRLPTTATAAVARVINGIGGVGKTRLALEYALRHADAYSALLFVGAESPEALQRGLAALCSASVLDLPERHETDEGRQYDAVLRWLRGHPGWLLLVDNVDSEDAAVAAEALLPRLAGGHVVVGSRLANWSGRLALPPLEVLAPADAADFLLTRSDGRRRALANDAALGRQLADELGGLALALEQAGAYITQRRLSFTQYLDEWQSQREKVLAWYDARLMQYPKSVAITWQTTFDRLGEPARRLLQRLAWLAPEPIPESLLAVAAPGEGGDAGEVAGAQADSLAALVELESYSLVRRASDAPSFTIHRLVQEVSRRRLDDAAPAAAAALRAALAWVDATFVGDPDDVRNWPLLEPLAPHALAVAAYADSAGIGDPTAWLLNQVGLLLLAKARYAEAEPLLLRALAIAEARFSVAHPEVAAHLSSMAHLLQVTNRLAEAEPLLRR